MEASEPGEPTTVPDQVRAACAWVAGRAKAVRIEEEAIGEYAAGLEGPEGSDPDPAAQYVEGDREGRAAFAICLNAINFGSGWWPTIRKRPGHSGFVTVAVGLTERFREHGPWSASELSVLTPSAIATALGQDPEHPLMAQFAASLRDVGARLEADYAAGFATAVDAAAGSAPALAMLLASWEAFADTSTYVDRPVPFFKRAQLAAADVHRAGVTELRDLDRPPPSPTTSSRTCFASTACSASTPRSPPASKPASSSSTAPPRRSSCAPARCTRSSSSPPPART